MNTLLQKIVGFISKPKFKKLENKIGWKLSFHYIPDRFVNGLVEWDLTKTLRKFGLDIEEGADYWTLGQITNGISSRFDRNSPLYQSWLGGYIVKLPRVRAWTVEDHFKLAIADQNSWLHIYGDPDPMTSTEGCEFKNLGQITLGEHTGTLYEGECVTHSDVGNNHASRKFRMYTDIMANLFNLSNQNLHIEGKMLRPGTSPEPYGTLKLHGYVAIFEVEETVKVVLYGNGAIIGETNTFETIKDELLKAIQSCEIIKNQ